MNIKEFWHQKEITHLFNELKDYRRKQQPNEEK